MKRRVEIIDSVLTADDWEITIDRRTLMSSMLNRSEIALGEMACRPLADRPGSWSRASAWDTRFERRSTSYLATRR